MLGLEPGEIVSWSQPLTILLSSSFLFNGVAMARLIFSTPAREVRRLARRPGAAYRTSEWFRAALEALCESLPPREETPQRRPRGHAEHAPTDAPPSIVIVSRSAELSAFLTEALREGFHLRAAETGLGLLDDARRPDLLITDFATQADDDFLLLATARQHAGWAQIPILLLLQEWLSLANLEKAFELAPQTDAVLFLPLHPRKLRRTIHRLLAAAPTNRRVL